MEYLPRYNKMISSVRFTLKSTVTTSHTYVRSSSNDPINTRVTNCSLKTFSGNRLNNEHKFLIDIESFDGQLLYAPVVAVSFDCQQNIILNSANTLIMHLNPLNLLI